MSISLSHHLGGAGPLCRPSSLSWLHICNLLNASIHSLLPFQHVLIFQHTNLERRWLVFPYYVIQIQMLELRPCKNIPSSSEVQWRFVFHSWIMIQLFWRRKKKRRVKKTFFPKSVNKKKRRIWNSLFAVVWSFSSINILLFLKYALFYIE